MHAATPIRSILIYNRNRSTHFLFIHIILLYTYKARYISAVAVGIIPMHIIILYYYIQDYYTLYQRKQCIRYTCTVIAYNVYSTIRV